MGNQKNLTSKISSLRKFLTLLFIVIIYLLPVGEKPEFISYNGQIVEVSQTKPILQSIYPQGVYATCGDGGTGTNCHTGCCSAGACVVCPPQPDDEPPIINTSLNCSQTGNNGWCIGSLTLDLSASDPQGQAILISGTLNDIAFTCPTAICSIPISTEGTGTITYRVDSSTGLSDSGTTDYKLDISTPQLNGSVSGVVGTNSWYRSNATLTITSDDSISGIASVTTTIDAGIQTAYTSPISFADGTYSVLITATDNAGNVTQTTQSIQVDTINPNINASLNGKNGNSGWYVSNVEVMPTALDAGSGINTFEAKIDDSAWITAFSGQPLAFSNGNHTYQLRATDNAGNSTTTPIQTIKVDTIAPFIDITTEVDLGDTIYYELQDPSTGPLGQSGQAGSGLSIYRAVIEDEDERYQKIVWLDSIGGNKLSDQILWDGKFKDGIKAGIGDYFVTLKISDAAGNERMKTAIVHVNLLSFLQDIPTFTPPQTNLQLENFEPSNLQPFDNTQDEPETAEPETSFGGSNTIFADGDFTTGSFGVPSSTNPITNIPFDPNILWGATAAAVLGYTLAEWEKQREEERKRKEAEEAEAEKRKNTEKRKDQKEAETAVRERWAQQAAEASTSGVKVLSAPQKVEPPMPKGLSPEAQAAFMHGGGSASNWINNNATALQTQYAADLAKQKEREREEAALAHRMGEHQVLDNSPTLWERLSEWVKSPSTWFDVATDDHTEKILKNAEDIPLYLPLIKGVGPQYPSIKSPAWYLEKYGIESVDDIIGPLKTTLVDKKTIRALGRMIGGISNPVLFGIGLTITVLPNLITNIRDRNSVSQTIADVIVDVGGFIVSEIAGIVAAIGINFVVPGLGTLFTFGTKLAVDAGASIAWDTAAEANDWSGKLSNWIDQTTQNLVNRVTDAFDVNKYPPIPTPTPSSVSQPVVTPSTSSTTPEVVPTQNPSAPPPVTSTPTPPP